MPLSTLHRVYFTPSGKCVAVSHGSTVHEAVSLAGIQLWSVCGGQGDCGQCGVIILEGESNPLTEEEREILTAAELRDHHRLACRVRISGPMKVHILPRSLHRN